MYPLKFDYYRAGSVQEALSLMQAHPGAKYLAGGHSLIPILNQRLADPGVLIDIGRISGLNGIRVIRDGSCAIGALTTHTQLAASTDVPTALSEAAGKIGDPQVRNRGTIGGNVSHADPASDLPTVLTTLKATFVIAGSDGTREVAADEFFTDLFTTALQDGEILQEVVIRTPQPGRVYNNAAGSAYAKLANPASRYAMVGAAASLVVEHGRCSTASVAVGGLTTHATRASSVEAVLVGQKLDADTIAAAAAAVQNDLGDDVMGDIHASADYRRQMATVFVKRALTAAAERTK